MAKFERLERGILIFLVAALILGLTISVLRKFHSPAIVTVEKFDAQDIKTASDDDSLSYQKIDINIASPEELMKIKGIGKTISERIVDYRYNNGSFASIDDIKKVKGVGVALFEKIKTKIKVE